jgi:predicted site-specific integrase-resolvase
MNTLKLADASRSLGIPYQTLYFAVARGLVPAQRDRTGSRWLVKEANLPLIAQRLGVSYPPRFDDTTAEFGA